MNLKLTNILNQQPTKLLRRLHNNAVIYSNMLRKKVVENLPTHHCDVPKCYFHKGASIALEPDQVCILVTEPNSDKASSHY